MSERVVLCYGDSNTWGWIPAEGGRFPRDVRWPGVLAAELGAGWQVIEEGLGGRTTVFDDPLEPGRTASPSARLVKELPSVNIGLCGGGVTMVGTGPWTRPVL